LVVDFLDDDGGTGEAGSDQGGGSGDGENLYVQVLQLSPPDHPGR